MRISFCRGRGKIRHNNRDMVAANVDKERIKNNIELVRPQNVKEAYKEIFGEAQKNYNEKQKRANRKIDDYYTSLFGKSNSDTVVKNNNKQQNFYEWVVGIGDKDTTGYAANPELAKAAEKCLQIYFNGSKDLGIKSFNERNPKMHVFNAVIHCDEATPHLHFDGIPFADGYKNGMSRQTAITKSLEQMGYGKGAETIKNFTQSERKILREIAEAHGLKIDEEQQGREHTLSVREYKQANAKMIEEIKPQAKQEAMEIAMQEVGFMQPTPTKTVKYFGREKEVAKTEAEIQRDRDVALAQVIINDRDRLLSEARKKAAALEAEAEETALQIVGSAKKKADNIMLTAEKGVEKATQDVQAQQDTLQALKQARRELLEDIRNSLPTPPVEAAQRAIQTAQQARQRHIETMIHRQDGQEQQEKTNIERID